MDRRHAWPGPGRFTRNRNIVSRPLQAGRRGPRSRNKAPAFVKQGERENELIEQGVAFPLVQALLGLNDALSSGENPAIEVVVVLKITPSVRYG